MAALVNILQIAARQPVVDRTGLHGKFDLELEYAPLRSADDVPSGPSLVTAVEEQWGLKLRARKQATPVMVIDGVRPF